MDGTGGNTAVNLEIPTSKRHQTPGILLASDSQKRMSGFCEGRTHGDLKMVGWMGGGLASPIFV